MHVKFIVKLFFFILIFTACEKEDLTAKLFLPEPPQGYWVNRQVMDSLFVFERSDKFAENDYGFALLPGGKFLERKNAGWCGTPPVFYGDFRGTWTYNYPDIIIETRYWGGTVIYRWQLISAGEKYLKIKIDSEIYSPEN